jgi:CRISPR system Cascade subunit CasE
MYLTQIVLSKSNRNVQKALANRNLFHGAIESAFSNRDTRKLWRLDQTPSKISLYIVSDEKPDLESFDKQFDGMSRTRNYDSLLDQLENGQQYCFRLEANPTFYQKRDDNPRGVVIQHKTVEYQRNWLEKQADKNGFELKPDQFQIVGSKTVTIQKGRENRKFSFAAATYEGMLTVTNAEEFKSMLVNGIGREKAYGYGLMTLVKVQNG